MPRTVARPKDTPPQTARKRCSICADENTLDLVERKLAEGFVPYSIERFLRSEAARESGYLPIKQETISNHIKGCTARREATKNRRIPPKAIPAGIYAMAEAAVPLASADHPDDIATMVRELAAQRLRDGDILPGIKDGLKAQELLDRRAEKQRGREVAITVARILAGVQAPRSVLPDVRTVGDHDDEVIEGSAVEITG